MRIKAFSAILFLNLILLVFLAACARTSACEVFGDLPVCDLFLEFYQQHGEGVVLGYPVTQTLRDGDYYIQYFEKAVLQYPVSNPRLNQVKLRPLGLVYSQPTPMKAPKDIPECVYFERYGHHICLAFHDFYARHGGERVFGQPISGIKLENGVQTQNFENAQFRWTLDQITGPRIELADWGKQACYEGSMPCVENAFQIQAALDRSNNDLERGIAEFVAQHGGVEVFGRPVAPLVYAGDRVYQFYEKACFLWTPGRIQPVSLAPLGALDAPLVPREDPPDPSEDTLYSPESGHKVVLAFRDFYLQYGGREVFGLPLTDFMQDGGLWFQWFENARLEWRPDLPNGQRVQLTPLGKINSLRFKGALPTPEARPAGNLPTPLPPEIVLLVVPESPLLPMGDPQLVNLLAHDPAGRPFSGVVITLYVTTSASQRVIVLPPTDAEGRTWINLGKTAGTCTEVVNLRAVAETSGPMALANGQFTLWCAPEQ